MKHVSAHYDGEKVILDEPVSLSPNTPVEVVIPDSEDERARLRTGVFLASLPSLKKYRPTPATLNMTSYDRGNVVLVAIVKKPFTTITIGIFALVALLHVFRLAFGWEVTFRGSGIPLWVSGLGVVIAGGLAVMVWRESREC